MIINNGQRSAIISACGLYRLRLDRVIANGGRVAAYFGVNPSKADGLIDDATIRKLYGFSERIDVGRFMVGNKFAYRATDVDELRRAADPVGPSNNTHLLVMMKEADILVACWGPLGKLPKHLRGRWKDLVKYAADVGKPLHCFGVTADGQPRHPLMLSYSTPLEVWNPPT